MSTMRTIQAALNPGFDQAQQNALRDALPTVIQSYLSANSSPVNASTSFIDSGLTLEITSSMTGTNVWVFNGTIGITSSAAAGAQLQFVASDGLNIVASLATINVYSAAAGVSGTTTIGGGGVTSGAINTIGADFFGTVQVTGEGKLKLQFTQAVNTAVNTTVNAGSYMEAYTLLV